MASDQAINRQQGVPLGALAEVRGQDIELVAAVCSSDGRRVIRALSGMIMFGGGSRAARRANASWRYVSRLSASAATICSCAASCSAINTAACDCASYHDHVQPSAGMSKPMRNIADMRSVRMRMPTRLGDARGVGGTMISVHAGVGAPRIEPLSPDQSLDCLHSA